MARGRAHDEFILVEHPAAFATNKCKVVAHVAAAGFLPGLDEGEDQ